MSNIMKNNKHNKLYHQASIQYRTYFFEYHGNIINVESSSRKMDEIK